MSPSRNRLRRGAVTATLALTIGGLFAAFGVVGSSASGSHHFTSSSRPANKIVVLAYGDAQNTAEQYAVDTYNKTAEGKKVKAVLQTIPGANYQTKLQTIMGSSNAPDVFFNWGGGSITQFQKAHRPSLPDQIRDLCSRIGAAGSNGFRHYPPCAVSVKEIVRLRYHFRNRGSMASRKTPQLTSSANLGTAT